MNFFLDVDGDSRDFELLAVLFVLTLPDELRVERGITGVEQAGERNSFWFAFVIGYEISELFGGDVRALVFVFEAGYAFAIHDFFGHGSPIENRRCRAEVPGATLKPLRNLWPG